MKKKIFLMLALALMISCLLIVSASADSINPSSSDEYNENLTLFDDAIGNTEISDLKNDGTLARSVITDGKGNYYTVPTVYLLTEHKKNYPSGVMFNFKLSEISAKIGFTVSKTSIVRLEMPADISFICSGDENLSGCSNMVEVKLCNGLSFWDESDQRKAFTNCKSLKTIDCSMMQFNKANCCASLFEYCESLETIILPDAYFNGTSYMNYNTQYMFQGCKKLKTIENMEGFFKGTNKIAYRTFRDCNSLLKVDLWDGLEIIDRNSFVGCSSIETIVFPETVTTIGGTNGSDDTVFASCTSLKKVVFPSGAVTLGYYCFEKCTALTDVWMPGAGSQFNKQVFGQCGSNRPINFYFQTEESTVTILDSVNNNDPFITAINNKDTTRLKFNTPLSTKCEVFFNNIHIGTDDGDCSTKLLCTRCSTEMEPAEELHKYDFVISYANGYDKNGAKTYTCSACNKSYNDTVAPAPLFVCLGYSTPMVDGDSLTLGFLVNNDALDAYTANTGKVVKFGMFATKYENIDGTILDENGNEKNGAIKADINIKVTSFDFIISGFETDVHKNAKLALGAYVIATDAQGEGMEISYMQFNAPEEGYSYITYNDALVNNQQ